MLKARLKDPALLVERSYVGGDWCEADGGGRIPVFDPATGAEIAQVPFLGIEEVRRAVQAAEDAFGRWRGRSAGERAAVLERWASSMIENVDDLAAIMTAEQGKPLEEARGEIRYGASFAKWFAEEARRAYGETIPGPTADHRVLVLKQPVGVSAAITPWNFPNAMITRKCAPALAAGCPVVVKPSELTPLSALALAELADRAGIPPGVFNVVTGAPEAIGRELTGNPTVRKLSFTGSTRVGQILMRECADTVKRVSLELGGNAPFIVFDDADLDLAVAGVMASKFRNAGQTCVCANRILVQDAVFADFTARLAAAVGRLKVGNGFSTGVTIGPVINHASVEKIRRHVDDALAKGARALTGGVPEGGDLFVTPTILEGATTEMLLANEETFGPVAPLFRFHSEREAVETANATPFGLAAYFYTSSLNRSWRVAEQLEFGMVGLNTGTLATEVAPFGGMKQSGVGREGSRCGMDEYLELKALHVGGLR